MSHFIGLLKSQSIGTYKTDDVTLEFKKEFPQCESIEHAEKIHEAQAEAIEHALHKTIAGGTYDRVVALMLKRTASNLVVSYKDKIKPSIKKNCSNCGIMAKSSCDSCSKDPDFSGWIPRNY